MTVVSVKNEKGHLVKAELSDGKTVFIERDFAAEICLKAGSEFTEAELKKTVAESEYRRAKSRAAWFLDRGDRTEKTLFEKIVSGGISREAAAKAVARFKELDLVNDRRYAENYYRKLCEQNVSKRAAYGKMYEKGLPSPIIKAVIGEDGGDETEKISALIEKKYKNKLLMENGKQKTVAALMRKGFSYSAIKEALKNYNTEIKAEEF